MIPEDYILYNGRPQGDGGSPQAARVYDMLDRLGIAYATLVHPPVFTMQAHLEAERRLGAPICKNLFLSDRRLTRFFLLMLAGDARLGFRALAQQLATTRLSLAPDTCMARLLGVGRGLASPLCLASDGERRVELLIDRRVAAMERVGCHPCTNTATVALPMDDLLGRALPAMGHTYRLVDAALEDDD